VELLKGRRRAIPIFSDDLSNSNAEVLERLKEITGKTLTFYQGDCNDDRF